MASLLFELLAPQSGWHHCCHWNDDDDDDTEVENELEGVDTAGTELVVGGLVVMVVMAEEVAAFVEHCCC